MFEMGITVRDTISGFRGVVTGHCTYISGCDQYLVSPKCGRQGEVAKSHWFDVQRLEKVPNKKRIALPAEAPPGFGKPAPIK